MAIISTGTWNAIELDIDEYCCTNCIKYKEDYYIVEKGWSLLNYIIIVVKHEHSGSKHYFARLNLISNSYQWRSFFSSFKWSICQQSFVSRSIQLLLPFILYCQKRSFVETIEQTFNGISTRKLDGRIHQQNHVWSTYVSRTLANSHIFIYAFCFCECEKNAKSRWPCKNSM